MSEPAGLDAAVAAARREALHPTQDLHNQCLKAVRTWLGIPFLFGSAIVAWSHVPVGDRFGGHHPPAGYPMFWRVGSFGHVALSAGGGKCYSTDIKRRGRVDLVPMSLIHDRWGAHYLGFTTQLNEVELPHLAL